MWTYFVISKDPTWNERNVNSMIAPLWVEKADGDEVDDDDDEDFDDGSEGAGIVGAKNVISQ